MVASQVRLHRLPNVTGTSAQRRCQRWASGDRARVRGAHLRARESEGGQPIDRRLIFLGQLAIAIRHLAAGERVCMWRFVAAAVDPQPSE